MGVGLATYVEALERSVRYVKSTGADVILLGPTTILRKENLRDLALTRGYSGAMEELAARLGVFYFDLGTVTTTAPGVSPSLPDDEATAAIASALHWAKFDHGGDHDEAKADLKKSVNEAGEKAEEAKSEMAAGNDNDADSRDHWPYCFTAVVAGGGMKRGHVHGKSDETGSAPLEKPVHPTDLLATIYHALGIDPHTMVMNHLDQPRELVKGRPVLDLFA